MTGLVATDLAVQRAAAARLDDQLPWWLEQVEAANGITNPIPRPQGKTVFDRVFDRSGTARKAPYLVAIVTGDTEPPARRGRRYTTTPRLGLVAVVGGKDRDEVDERSKLYGLALVACALSDPTWGGLALASDWTSRRYDLLDAQQSRTKGSVEVQFAVEVADTLDLDELPEAPPPGGGPAPDLPVVESVRVEVHPRPVEVAP